jgi:ABC-type phosphate transport system auxiliary subunit
MSHKRSYPNTHHAYPACMGCAWSWMPSAAVTFRIVATLGLPSPDNAL